MARCSNCESEDREGGRFCEACGARIEPESAEPELRFAPMHTEEEGPAASTDEDEGAADSIHSEDAGPSDSAGEPEPGIDSPEAEGTGLPDSTDEAESEIDSIEAEGDEWADSTETEGEVPPEPPKAGYLIFPDNTEQPIPPSQWLIGRADLAKYVPDPDKANEISRGHVTVFQEGERFFIEDGKTMVQRRPSTNKTWLVRGTSRILVTGTGRTELQDSDEIDIAELVKLQFVVK